MSTEDDQFPDLLKSEDLIERGPPKRDPWDEYAIEKAHSLLIDEEFHIEEHNRNSSLWAVSSAAVIGIAIVQLWRKADNDPFWDLVYLFVAMVSLIASIAVRVHGSFLLRRLAKRHKWLDKNGLRFL